MLWSSCSLSGLPLKRTLCSILHELRESRIFAPAKNHMHVDPFQATMLNVSWNDFQEHSLEILWLTWMFQPGMDFSGSYSRTFTKNYTDSFFQPLGILHATDIFFFFKNLTPGSLLKTISRLGNNCTYNAFPKIPILDYHCAQWVKKW